MVQDIRTTLTELRHLRRRVAGQELTAGDWPVIGTLLSKEIARAERRLAKMLAKLEASEGGMTGPFIDDGDAVAEDEEDEEGDCGSSGSDQDGDAARGDSCTSPAGRADGASAAEPDPRRKGHGRNGAGAYVNAEHDFHALLDGILGGVCEACGVGRMSRHRAKLIVMVKGQPLFDARVHHFEQARCRQCGAIVRAEGEAALTGLGSSYIRYHESAAAMLLVMHYFADMPFKRLESLQAGWGIPLSDANQWSLADASADRLFPLYKALERHGVQNALALRIDDTDSRASLQIDPGWVWGGGVGPADASNPGRMAAQEAIRRRNTQARQVSSGDGHTPTVSDPECADVIMAATVGGPPLRRCRDGQQ